MAAVIIDRERALVTARSVLANVDVLEEDGLDAAGQASVTETAERLATGLAGAGSLDDATAAELARGLREILATASGQTAATYVTWLDGVLDPEG